MEASPEARALIGAFVTLIVTSAFIHFGAGYVVKRRNVVQAVMTALGGSFLAGLVLTSFGFGGAAILLALAVWALVAGFMYRTSWIGGIAIGVMAWLLWWFVNFLVRLVAKAMA